MDIKEIVSQLNCIERYESIVKPKSGVVCDLYEKDIEALQEAIKLLRDIENGDVIVLPEGYEHFEDLWHIVNMPNKCNEDALHCDYCKYGKGDECTFKPYANKISIAAVYKAIRVLHGLSRTHAEAVSKLKEG